MYKSSHVSLSLLQPTGPARRQLPGTIDILRTPIWSQGRC